MQTPFYTDNDLAKIIKTGEDRARWGQTNQKHTATELVTKREIVPQNHMTREVAALLAQFEFQKFHQMGDPLEWGRLEEIRVLALDQVQDDALKSYSHRIGRVGRKTVALLGDIDDTISEDDGSIWKPLNRDQLALGEGLAIIIERLTPTQQETLRMRYWQGLSQREAGEQLQVTKKSVEVNEGRAKTAIRKHLHVEFPMELEFVDEVSV